MACAERSNRRRGSGSRGRRGARTSCTRSTARSLRESGALVVVFVQVAWNELRAFEALGA